VKVSIITAVKNNRAFMGDCLLSVAGQTWPDIEHIIVDGASTDGTMEVISQMASSGQAAIKVISGQDCGIYDALNKGIEMATGDIIGFLHSDDLYENPSTIETVAAVMSEQGVEGCYGDLVYVDREDIGRIIRYWKSSRYTEGMFQRGWMPAHPTFFVRKEVYTKYGRFNTDYAIAADYELMLRFLCRYGISTHYIPEVLVRMRTGGASNRSLRTVIIKTREDYMAWEANGLQRRFYTIPLKNLSKIPQFFRRQAGTHSG